MDRITIRDNRVEFTREGELMRVTPVHQNAIRFEAFPDCRAFDEDFTLLPQSTPCLIEERDRCVYMTVGSLTIGLEDCGKVTFY